MYKFCPYCGFKVDNLTYNGFKCANCHKNFYLTSRPTSSIFAVFEDQVLVGIRKIEPKKGEIDVIGGFLNYGEDPVDGAVREFEEETGYKIKGSDLKYLGIWMGQYLYQEENLELLNVMYYIEFDHKPELTPSDDVEELIWVPLSENQQFAFEALNKAFQKLKEEKI